MVRAASSRPGQALNEHVRVVDRRVAWLGLGREPLRHVGYPERRARHRLAHLLDRRRSTVVKADPGDQAITPGDAASTGCGRRPSDRVRRVADRWRAVRRRAVLRAVPAGLLDRQGLADPVDPGVAEVRELAGLAR